MNNKDINKVVLIGAGKVATCLAYALHDKRKRIVQVYSRTELKAKELASRYTGTEFTTDLKSLADADLYIIVVTDSAITKVVNQLEINKGILVHTAGSVNMDSLKSASAEYGVIYPLQTFVKGRSIDFYNKVPLCIEASNKSVESRLVGIAELISAHVYMLDSVKRMTLHLAAIFANNFTNYMYVAAEKLLKEKNIPFDSLKLLIEETSNIIMDNEHPEVYTGPAVRNDMITIRKHFALLKNKPELKQLYELITKNIIND